MNEHGPAQSPQNEDMSMGARMAAMHGAGVRKASADSIEETVSPDAPTASAESIKVPVVEILPEIQREPEFEQMTWQHFDDRATDIANEFQNHAGEQDSEAGFRSVMKAYGTRNPENEEDPPELIKFGKLLATAPKVYEVEQTLEALREKRRDLYGSAPTGRRPKLSEEDSEAMAKATRIVCAYNQLLGSLVAKAEKAMPPAKLTRWLSDAVGGDPEWSEKIVFGLQTEQAGLKLVSSVPGLENVMPGDLDQDLEGKDIVFDTTPSGHDSVDTKSRSHRGVMPVQLANDTRRMTLYIDPAHMDRKGYRVHPKWESGYRDALAMVLIKKQRLAPGEGDVYSIAS